MLDGTYLQVFGALLFGVVFLFLWRQSTVVYFGFWALAWGVETAASICTMLAGLTHSPRWLAAHSLLEFGFALSLVSAARVGSPRQNDASWRGAMRMLYLFPAFLLVLELIGWESPNAIGALRSFVLTLIYLYNYRELGFHIKKLFHLTLLALAMLNFANGLGYVLLSLSSSRADLVRAYMTYSGYYDLGLKTLLAFAAMAMWIESQNDRVIQIANELDRVRRETSPEGNLDYLTGLFNSGALQRRIDGGELFYGVAAVCDLDDFKSINDRFGHIVGDEVLRNVGHLLHSSVRGEDMAYRWGGDEFAILFNDQEAPMARSRMQGIEARLRDFRVRGHGSLRIQFSWGVAEGRGAALRNILEQADGEMYAQKRERPGRAGAQALTHVSKSAGSSEVSSTSPT